VRALTAIRLSDCNLTGESMLFSYVPVVSNVSNAAIGMFSLPNRCFVVNFFRYRTNPARNRQIDEFAVSFFECRPADRSINSQFYTIILEANLYVKQNRGEPVHHPPFWLFCHDFIQGLFRPKSSN
jgi:hypothetical protein